MQSTEQEALSPPELQSRINDILTASPNIAEAVSLLVKMSILTCNTATKEYVLLECAKRVYRDVNSSWLLGKITTSFDHIGQLLCLSVLYRG